MVSQSRSSSNWCIVAEREQQVLYMFPTLMLYHRLNTYKNTLAQKQISTCSTRLAQHTVFLYGHERTFMSQSFKKQYEVNTHTVSKKFQIRQFKGNSRANSEFWNYLCKDLITITVFVIQDSKWDILNPLSTNPAKWSNTQTICQQFTNELFECVWPFCDIGT